MSTVWRDNERWYFVTNFHTADSGILIAARGGKQPTEKFLRYNFSVCPGFGRKVFRNLLANLSPQYMLRRTIALEMKLEVKDWSLFAQFDSFRCTYCWCMDFIQTSCWGPGWSRLSWHSMRLWQRSKLRIRVILSLGDLGLNLIQGALKLAPKFLAGIGNHLAVTSKIRRSRNGECTSVSY